MDRELTPMGNQRFVNVRSVAGEKPKRMPGSGGRLVLIASPSHSVAVSDKTPSRRNKCGLPLLDAQLSARDFPGNGPVVDPAFTTDVPVLISKDSETNHSIKSVAHYSAIALVTLVQKSYLKGIWVLETIVRISSNSL